VGKWETLFVFHLFHGFFRYLMAALEDNLLHLELESTLPYGRHGACDDFGNEECSSEPQAI
jgi:hypothetical protein